MVLVLTKSSLLRQAEWLLKLSKTAADPDLAATLIKRAADLKEEADKSPDPDPSPQDSDVEAKNLAAGSICKD